MPSARTKAHYLWARVAISYVEWGVCVVQRACCSSGGSHDEADKESCSVHKPFKASWLSREYSTFDRSGEGICINGFCGEASGVAP